MLELGNILKNLYDYTKSVKENEEKNNLRIRESIAERKQKIRDYQQAIHEMECKNQELERELKDSSEELQEVMELIDHTEIARFNITDWSEKPFTFNYPLSEDYKGSVDYVKLGNNVYCLKFPPSSRAEGVVPFLHKEGYEVIIRKGNLYLVRMGGHLDEGI